MANASSLVFAGIAPHPPIMVPEVGREAIVDVRASIEAMSDLTQRVIASGAETVVLISPHAPLQSDDRFGDRKSTRLNSSHSSISYAVFCLKKKKKRNWHFSDPHSKST